MEWTVMWNRSPSVTSWNDCLVYLAQRMRTQKQLLLPDHFLFLPSFAPPCHLTKPLSVNNLCCWQTGRSHAAELRYYLQTIKTTWKALQNYTDLRLSTSFGHVIVAIVVQLSLVHSIYLQPPWTFLHQKKPGIFPSAGSKLDICYILFAYRTFSPFSLWTFWPF